MRQVVSFDDLPVIHVEGFGLSSAQSSELLRPHSGDLLDRLNHRQFGRQLTAADWIEPVRLAGRLTN